MTKPGRSCVPSWWTARTQADVATEYGVSKQRVNSLMGDFQRNYIAQAAATGNTVVSVFLDMPETRRFRGIGSVGCAEGLHERGEEGRGAGEGHQRSAQNHQTLEKVDP